jgi:hypothetical protein
MNQIPNTELSYNSLTVAVTVTTCQVQGLVQGGDGPGGGDGQGGPSDGGPVTVSDS